MALLLDKEQWQCIMNSLVKSARVSRSYKYRFAFWINSRCENKNPIQIPNVQTRYSTLQFFFCRFSSFLSMFEFLFLWSDISCVSCLAGTHTTTKTRLKTTENRQMSKLDECRHWARACIYWESQHCAGHKYLVVRRNKMNRSQQQQGKAFETRIESKS